MKVGKPLGILAGVAGAGAAAALIRSRANSDRHFLREIASSGMAEAELGRLAAERATSLEVRQFAARMAQAHDELGARVRALAKKLRMQLPSRPLVKHRWKVAVIERHGGEDFDRAFMRLVVREHGKDIVRLQRKVENSGDKELRAFAGATASLLEEHQKEGLDIYRAMPREPRPSFPLAASRWRRPGNGAGAGR